MGDGTLEGSLQPSLTRVEIEDMPKFRKQIIKKRECEGVENYDT